MAEAVVLGDLELDRVTGIVMEENRKLAVHPWPGATGDLVQDMGMGAARIWLSGVAAGEESARRLEQVRQAMQEGKPLDFTASVAVASAVEQVMVTGLRAMQPPGRASYYEYQLSLIQYVPPPPPLSTDFDLGALEQIELDSLSGALDNVTGALDEAAKLAEMAEEGMDLLSEAAAMIEKALDVVQGLGALEKVLSAAANVVQAAAQE
ncbi:MAG TPA: DNA circularization N-terminal domain-containing protein [Symbiobacteriaceae bacterium]|nr:DNA circularization N-terminal domain-containing protein [Symbiobacteriaceae bacterium]